MMRSHCKDSMGVPKAVLTVLPAGSSNDFHRSMGWSQDFEESMWRIGNRGETALIDLGKVTCIGPSGGPLSRYFINIASFGVSGMVSGREDKYNFWGPLKYKIAGFVECLRYITFKKSPILVSYDGGDWEFVKNITLVAACNGNTFANGMKLSDNASPFTGNLDMVTASCGRNIFKVIATMEHMGKGMPSRSSAVSARQCKRIDILAADSKGNPLEESMVYTPQPENELQISRQESNASFAREESNASFEDLESTQEIHPVCDEGTDVSAQGRTSLNHSKDLLMRHKENLKKLVAHRYPVECDGECVGHLPATYEIIPHAIKMRVPKDTTLTGSK